MPQQWLAMSHGFAPTLDQEADVWATMRQGAPFLHKYANDLFDTAAETNKDVAARVNIIKALLQAVEDDVQEFHKSFRVLSPAEGGSEAPSLGQVSEEIDRAFEKILKRVHETFPAPNEAAHHDDRQRLIERILKEAEIELFEILCVKHKLVDEEAFRRFWRGVSPIIERIVVTTGDLLEQHPRLTEFVVTAVVFMLVPESWFTKPLLRLIGFGPLGPVKGSLAAWAQRVFYGANVGTKTIFAYLQSAAMRYGTPIFIKVVASLGLALGIVTSTWSLCHW